MPISAQPEPTDLLSASSQSLLQIFDDLSSQSCVLPNAHSLGDMISNSILDQIIADFHQQIDAYVSELLLDAAECRSRQAFADRLRATDNLVLRNDQDQSVGLTRLLRLVYHGKLEDILTNNDIHQCIVEKYRGKLSADDFD